jgi:hypothetical protein
MLYKWLEALVTRVGASAECWQKREERRDYFATNMTLRQRESGSSQASMPL